MPTMPATIPVPVILHPLDALVDETFFAFCEENTKLQIEMEAYIDDGVRLERLVDPQNEDAWIYRPKTAPSRLHKPSHLNGAPDFPDLQILLNHIWEPNW